ncbi:hypothetical protein [Alcanivorax sp.]|uniref:hypothetical protein n=1 Tax=Alcanivorax sp. TaxID=1872427 RepID=UPI0032D95C0F
MPYSVERWDSVDLNLQTGPFIGPVDPLTIELDYVAGVDPVPPLPWATPNLFVEYLAPLRRAVAAQGQTTIRLSPGVPADAETAGCWAVGRGQDLLVRARFEEAGQRDGAVRGGWGGAGASHAENRVAWHQSRPLDRARALPWGAATAGDRAGYVAGWIMKTPARDATKAQPWYSVNLAGTVYDDSAARYALLNTDTATTITLAADSGVIEITAPDNVELRFGWVKPARPSVPHDVSYRITARQAATRDNEHRLPWGAGQSIWHDYNLPYPVEPNPDPDPVEPPAFKTVYLIMNTLQITDVATGTALDIQGVSIGLDIDSWAWRFSGTLYGQGSLALVAPGAGGMKDIAVAINGHSWVFSIERYTSDERFPTEKFSITGVSRTQYMAAPFAPTRSYTNASATTAAQAATAELQNTGFTLTWPTGNDEDLPDWPIPAGALSFRDKSPAQVVAQIVTAAGGIMVPAMDADSWTVQPRYKVLPWDWGTATPDAGIYIGMVRSRSAQYEPGPDFNACYVSGVSQGQAVDVQRAGSGGTAPMPDIYEDLITDSQPAISRGKAELAAAGNKVVETLSVIIPESGAAPGVLVPGMIVKVMHDDSLLDYMALVLAVSISVQKAGGAEIYQSVTLERSA